MHLIFHQKLIAHLTFDIYFDRVNKAFSNCKLTARDSQASVPLFGPLGPKSRRGHESDYPLTEPPSSSNDLDHVLPRSPSEQEACSVTASSIKPTGL